MITPEQAERLAARLLDGHTTRLGGPHIEHARRVAGRVARGGDRVVVAALLHDVVEKDCISWNEFAAAVDDEEVVRLVDVVTRRDGEDERAFLRRCAQDPVARLIKRADLLDKLGPQDVEVQIDLGASVRREARERLALLDHFARERLLPDTEDDHSAPCDSGRRTTRDNGPARSVDPGGHFEERHQA